MRRGFIKALPVLLLAPSVVLISVPSAQAAGDCAVGVRAYQDGASNYADVRNKCGRTISAQALVNNFPDTGCKTIAPYATVTFRTGGSLSPKAYGAREC